MPRHRSGAVARRSPSSSPSRWPTAGPPAPTDPRPPAGRPGRLRTATRPSRARPKVRHAGRPAVRGSRSRRHQPEIGAASRRPERQDIGLSPAVGARQLVDLAEDPSRMPVDLLDHDGRRIEQHASTPSRRRGRWPRATARRRGRDRPCDAWPPREALATSTPVADPCSVRGSRRQDRRRRAPQRCRCCRAAGSRRRRPACARHDLTPRGVRRVPRRPAPARDVRRRRRTASRTRSSARTATSGARAAAGRAPRAAAGPPRPARRPSAPGARARARVARARSNAPRRRALPHRRARATVLGHLRHRVAGVR